MSQQRTCKICQKQFLCRPSEDRRGYIRTYCSIQCVAKRKIPKQENARRVASLKLVRHTDDWNRKVALSKFRDKNPSWIDGRSVVYGFGWNRKIKQLVRERDKNTCRVCGKDGKNSFPFPIHHIDLSKDNHSLENLMVVCRGCHLGLHEIHKLPDRRRKILNRKHILRIINDISVDGFVSAEELKKKLEIV